MAEKPMDLPLSNLLENYASLRDMNRKEFLSRKSRIYYTLELLRIILKLAKLIKLKDEFEKRLKKILAKTEIPCYSWHLVEESIKNYFYKILSEKDDSASVQMMFSIKNHADDPPLAIRENEMPPLLKRCEEVIVDLVKNHHIGREFEREEHSSRCVICLNEKALINIVDGGTPSFKKSIQVMVPNRPSIEQDRVSESLDQAPPNGHKTYRPISKEKAHQPVSHLEEIAGSKSIKIACEVIREYTTEKQCETTLLEEEDQTHFPSPECPRDQFCEVIQECTTEEICEAALIIEGNQTHSLPPECTEDQMVYEVIQECTTEEKCGAALLKEGAQTHLPPPECPRDQTVCEVIPGCTTQEKCEAVLLEEGARTHPPPPGCPGDQAQEKQLKKPCESCIDYDKKLCRSDELLTQEKQLVARNEKEKLAVEETCAILSRQITTLSEENHRLTLEAQETEAKYQKEINRISQVKEDLEDNKKTAKRDQNIQNTEIENLSKTLKSEKELGEQLELKLEHTESRLNTELAEANESLVSAMNDVTNCQEKMKGFEDLLKANETQRFGLKAELAVLKSTIEQNGDEKRSLLERGKKINVICDPEQKESESNYQKLENEIEEKIRKHKKYWGENKNRVQQENKKRLIGRHCNYALTYHHVRAGKIVDKVFREEQDALKWAHKNRHLMDDDMPVIRIWPLHKEHGRGWIGTKDLKLIDITLIDPSAKKRKNNHKKGKVVSKEKGMFDTGADIASVPYHPQSFQKMIHSKTRLNDKWVPVVYGQLIINGEKLRTIYPIELEKDSDWCAIGIPQIRKLKSTTSKRIIMKITKVLTSE